jgi:hypothetical protein
VLGVSYAAERGGFLDGLFNHLAGFAGGLLNPTEQFLLFTRDVLEIVIRQLGPLLFQLALGNVPSAFDFECVHGLKLRLRPALDDGVKPYRGLPNPPDGGYVMGS